MCDNGSAVAHAHATNYRYWVTDLEGGGAAEPRPHARAGSAQVASADVVVGGSMEEEGGPISARIQIRREESEHLDLSNMIS